VWWLLVGLGRTQNGHFADTLARPRRADQVFSGAAIIMVVLVEEIGG
jgi:hypothetical protein